MKLLLSALLALLPLESRSAYKPPSVSYGGCYKDSTGQWSRTVSASAGPDLNAPPGTGFILMVSNLYTTLMTSGHDQTVSVSGAIHFSATEAYNNVLWGRVGDGTHSAEVFLETGVCGADSGCVLDGDYSKPSCTQIRHYNRIGQPLNSPCNGQCAAGKPVNVTTGALWHQMRDFSVKGRTPTTALTLNRTYLAVPAATAGGFGPHWYTNFDMRVIPFGSDAVIFIDETGGAWHFFFPSQQNPVALGPPGLDGKMELFNTQATPYPYVVTRKDKSKLYFDTIGRIAKIEDVHGEALAIGYDEKGLATASSPMAGSLTFQWNSNHDRIVAVTRERDGLTYSYSYDATGTLETSTDFAGLSHHYRYETRTDAGGGLQRLLTEIIDPLGRSLKFTYYSDGRARQQYEPGGGVRTFVYKDHETRVKGIDGQVTRYFFDDDFHTTKTVHPDGTREYFRWIDGRISERSIDYGGSTKYSYDTRGNVTSIQRPEGDVTQITWHPTFDIPALITSPEGAPTQFLLDPNTGDLQQLNRGGLSLAFGRDVFGNLLSTNNGRATYADIRNADGLLTQAFSIHNAETITYDSRMRVATRQFASGRAVGFTYDDFDRVIRITDSAGPSTTNSFDAMGRLLQTTKSVGGTSQVTSYVYDDHDRLVSSTDALNRTTTFQYDPVHVIDKPKSITDPAGRVTQFFYDSRQRLVKAINAQGGVTSYTFDQRNNMTSVLDANGGLTTFAYDLNDRKIREMRQSVAGTSAVQRVTLYFWDSADHLVREITKSATGGEDRTIIYEYNSLDHMVKRTVQREGASGPIVEDISSFAYEDQLDANLMASAVNGVANLSFSNEAAPPFALSGFNVAASQSGNPFGLIEGSFAITRDVSGEIASVSKNGTALFSRTFDPAGRLTGVSTPSGFSTSIGYDGFGRKTSIAHSDGTSGSFTWDLLNRQTASSYTGTTPISEQLAYDSLTGNISSIQRENGSYTLAHDAIDQILSSATTGSANYNRSWSYSLSGDRIGDSQNGAGTYINHLLVANGVSSFLADPNGFGDVIRETSGSVVKNYFYRADDRMSGYSDSSNQVAYYHDALGRRVAKVFTGAAGNFTQSFLHLGQEDRILQAKAGDGTVTTYLDGLGVDQHLSEGKSGVFKGYVTDHLNSVLNGDAAGASHSFGIWGEQIATPAISAASSPVMYGFTGREHDAESGLDYHRARSRNKTVGSWMSQDPLGTDGGKNFYNYSGANPLLFTDPLGLARCTYSISQHILICIPNDAKSPAQIVGPGGVFSGEVGAYRNNPAMTGVKDLGPIPTGYYNISRHEDQINHARFFRLNPKFWTGLTTERRGFELHPGGISFGCVTVDRTNNRAMEEYSGVEQLLNDEINDSTLQVIR